MAKDFYAILGVAKTASQDEIKQAYRKLSKELHPDKHSSIGSEQAKKEVERKFKEVNEAYEALGDPEKRKRYDQFGAAGMNGGFGGGQGGGFGGFDFSGFQQGDFGSFGDLFENFFSGGRGGRPSNKGADREVALRVPFSDVVSGKRAEISIEKLVVCDSCSGNGAEKGSKLITCKECGGTGQVISTVNSIFGRVQQRTVCPTCRGSGEMPEKVCRHCSGEGRIKRKIALTIDIPAGIHAGQTLRFRGEGDAGRRGGEAGDLFVQIDVIDDRRFLRDGDDIRSSIVLPALDAILGTEITVETVHGPVNVSIAEGTQPGQVLRIKGKGMPVLNTHRHGDHYVTVDVEIPKKLGRKERQLLEEWRALRG